jgi:hypothetical protein
MAYQEFFDVVNEVIPYCFRPKNPFGKELERFVHPLSPKLSFEGAHLANITSQQLLSWLVPIEVSQRCQFYLNKSNAARNEYFYNCTEPWFGTRCQYLFPFGGWTSFNRIVEAAFHVRKSYSKSSDTIFQMPCYVLLECHRNGWRWCLDWREVCDGIVDCFDEGLDEEYCFDMEINECKENEYRCHKGLCISSELWEEGQGDADCLDRSDEVKNAFYISYCFQDPTFRCEEQSCRNRIGSFPCGDGQCVPKFDKCHNGRHLLLIESMIVQGNLTDECWIAMVCLIGFVDRINGNSCEIWLINNSAFEFLKQCDPFFQFPTIPVHSAHIRFYYKDLHLRQNLDEVLLPDYICYDQQLCDFIKPNLVREDLTCINRSKSVLDLIEMMGVIEQYFRPCLISHVISHNKSKNHTNDYSSLYKCQNSSKYISKHRLMDGNRDCSQEDDENYPNSCQLNHRYRVACRNASTCWSPVLKNDVCTLNEEAEEIPFQDFCNGIEQYTYYDNNGQNYNDEFACEDSMCDNIYARCDGYWACRDGRDENNCGHTKCPLNKHACVDRFNYTVFCLSADRVNNGIDDCLGASDEQHTCQRYYPPTEDPRRFRCLNDDTCLLSSQLCNNRIDCQSGDDDEKLCNIHQVRCLKISAYNRSEIEEVLCGMSEQENRRPQYFSVRTSSKYPSLENTVVDEVVHEVAELHSSMNINEIRVEDNVWLWYCNRGILVRIWVENNSFNNVCICPPSYYGHLCQYQNQRISLTLQLSSIDRDATYAIIIMLIDDNDQRQEIEAYDQFVYIAKDSCSIKFNRYLLFSTRPKDFSKDYSLRIDAFEKTSLTYVGSWYFPINFLFLPVNRPAISLILSNYPVSTSSSCSSICENGKCVKYLNKEKYFCQCNSEWTGVQCNIPINHQICSHNSYCMGSTNNQTICVCPSGKFGPQCLFTSVCPANACQNKGRCVAADVTIPESSYTCICPDRFYGRYCQYLKARLDVSITNIDIPPYLVAYFFTLSNNSQPNNTIIVRKLTLFQHIVTFHISILFHMVIIQANNKYYLAVLQHSPKKDISTLIDSSRECIPTEQLLNSTVLNMVHYRRVTLFHTLCHTRSDLMCLIDKAYFCLCTNDRHANCVEFKRDRNFQCPLLNHCENGAGCLQDHPTCPSTRICLCPKCFFGSTCQFYTKGLGATLDEILGYEFKRHTKLSEQPLTVKVSVAITILMCVIGIINGILSIMLFKREKPREVGCGLYLLTSSITSLTITILFTIKFWLLFISYQYHFEQHGLSDILLTNCRIIEPGLKLITYIDNWLNACVAWERMFAVRKAVHFDKHTSRRTARFLIILVLVINAGLYVLQIKELHVYTDKTEERYWCVVHYSSFIRIYSSTLIMFHYFGPLLITIISVVYIILSTTNQRSSTRSSETFWLRFRTKVRQYKHMIISSIVITILTLPNLIISIILDCNKSSHLLWFYLIGYFLSFTPATFIFLIFVLPSPLYKEEFRQLILQTRRQFNAFKSKFSR